MTELARNDPASRQLFQEANLAPLPRHRPIALGLEHWLTQRGRSLASAAIMSWGQLAGVVERSLIAEPLGPGHDFSLTGIGGAARHALGDPDGSARLSAVPARRLAVRLRRLFALVGEERGEPIDAHFTECGRSYGLLAAPVLTDTSLPGFFCTIAAEEQRPVGDAR